MFVSPLFTVLTPCGYRVTTGVAVVARGFRSRRSGAWNRRVRGGAGRGFARDPQYPRHYNRTDVARVPSATFGVRRAVTLEHRRRRPVLSSHDRRVPIIVGDVSAM